MIVGIKEIVAGVLVLMKTKIEAYIVLAWLVCIALTLIFSWGYVDVAIRDLVTAIAAFSLANFQKWTQQLKHRNQKHFNLIHRLLLYYLKIKPFF